jgi:hypothetical protein
MSPLTSPVSPVLLLELHDARLRELRMAQRGCEIELSELSVYHQHSSHDAEVWAYRARLVVLGCGRVTWSGQWLDSHRVSDGLVWGSSGNEVSLTGFLRPGPFVRLRLDLDSGSWLEVAGTTLRVDLLEPLRVLDYFDGQLFDPTSAL